MKTWSQSVLDYFRFVYNRRPDTRFGIFPNAKICLLIAVLSAAAIYAAHVFADSRYFEWYYAHLWHHDRSSIFFHTTDIGKSDWMLWSSGSVLLLMSLFPLSGASRHLLVLWHHLFLKVYFFFTAIALSGVLAIILKIVIGRARPVATLPEHEAWNSVPFFSAFENTGFPSGHSTSIGALCMVLLLLVPRIGKVFVFVAIWVGVSRMVVGAHFPSDVVAGLLLGTFFTWLHARNFAKKRLLFEFTDSGTLRRRNKGAKRARNKSRKRARAGSTANFTNIVSKSI